MLSFAQKLIVRMQIIKLFILSFLSACGKVAVIDKFQQSTLLPTHVGITPGSSKTQPHFFDTDVYLSLPRVRSTFSNSHIEMFENLKRKNLDMDLQYRQLVISYRKTFQKLVLVDNTSDKLYFGRHKKSCNCIFGLL